VFLNDKWSNRTIKLFSIVGITHASSKYQGTLSQSLAITEGALNKLGVSADAMTVSWQPEIRTRQRKLGLRTLLRSRILELETGAQGFFLLEWNGTSLLGKAIAPLAFFLRFARWILLGLLWPTKELRDAHIKENILTEKHIRAWTLFMEGTSEYLIVLEDDATISNEVFLETELKHVLEIIDSESLTSPIYLDLGSYYDYDSVYWGASKSKENISLPPSWYKAPMFANTTAAYLVNREFCQGALVRLTERPELRGVTIDWLNTFISNELNAENKVSYLFRWPSIYNNQSLINGDSSLRSEKFSARTNEV
jgi:hypothetical protein